MKHIKTAGLGLFVFAIVGIGMFPTPGKAIPEFARKYKTTCMRCHVGFPKLNAFGKNFQLHGYQQPGDATVDKVPTPEDKNLSLLDRVPLSILIENNLTLDKWVGNNNPTNISSPTVFHIFAAGTVAPDIGFFGELATASHVTDVGKVAVSLNHLGNQNIHLQVGQLDVMEHGVTEHDLFTRAGYGMQDVSLGGFQLSSINRGVRIYGMFGSSVTPELIHGPGKQKPADKAAPPPDGGTSIHGPNVKPVQEGVEELVDPMDQLKGFLWEVGIYNGGPTDAVHDAKDVSGRANMYFLGDSFVGVFGYGGQSTVVNGMGTSFENKHRMYGVDFSLQLGKPYTKAKNLMQKPFNILGGYISGSADNPNADGLKVSWNGYMLEGDYTMGSQSIFHLRYDRVMSKDLPSLELNGVTANYTFYLKTNFFVGLEYTHDLTTAKQHRLALLFDFAF